MRSVIIFALLALAAGVIVPRYATADDCGCTRRTGGAGCAAGAGRGGRGGEFAVDGRAA